MSEFACHARRGGWQPCPLLLCWLLLLAAVPTTPTLAFEIASLLVAFDGVSYTSECPSQCTCRTRRAEDVLQDRLTAFLPRMGQHMRPEIESELRSSATLLTAWLGNMADINCLVRQGEKLHLTDLLHTSTLSFKSIRLTCQSGGGVVWDMTPQTTFLNLLHMFHCEVFTPENSHVLPLPQNLWLLDLEGIAVETIHSLDLSTCDNLRFLSITNSELSSVPQQWSSFALPQMAFLNLAGNRLDSYECEVVTAQLTSLNLDHNHLKVLPPCVTDGSRTTVHLSVRHNHLQNLEGLLINSSEDNTQEAPEINYLDISHNDVRSILALKQIFRLLGLDASHNRISVLAPDAFSLNPELEWLDLSFNQLHTIPDGMLVHLAGMDHLNFSHNHLTALSSDQSPRSDKPIVMDLSHNRLIYPPFADTGFVPPRLTSVIANNNSYRCDCTIHHFQETVQEMTVQVETKWFNFYWGSSSQSERQAYLNTEQMTCNQPAEIQGLPLLSLSYDKVCPLIRGCPKDCLCNFVKGPSRYVSVNCSLSETLTELPAAVPMIPDISLVLYVNRSGLRRLDHRPYLRHVSELHADYSRLSSVAASALQALQNISVLNLHHNQLRSLPAILQNLTLAAVSNLSLSGNPWTCGCHDLWMPGWMAKHASALFDLNNTRCRWTGKPVSQLSAKDLSCGIFNYLPLVIALSIAVGLVAVASSLLAKYKLELLVFVFTHFRLRPFDMYRYDTTKPNLFDVFVSFSQHDYSWVLEKLVDQLENRARPYSLCIPLRDFPVGATLGDSVRWAVENSRCTLLVLTRDLLASEWSFSEFRAAHDSLLKGSDSRLVVLVHGPLDARSLDRPLLQYLRRHLYLRTEDKMFWSKLEYVLPAPQGPVLSASHATSVPVELSSSVEMDCIVPKAALAAGDVSPKHNDNSSSNST